MRGSLQDQLLKSGIATEDQLKKAKSRPTSGKHGSGHSSKKGPQTGKKNKSNANSYKDSAQNKTVASKSIQDDKTNNSETGSSAPASLGKALRTEIKQLLKTNKLNDKTGEIPYNYVIAGQVKRFYINEKQQTELKAGKMVIVNWNTISYLISTEAEQELRKLHPTIEVASVASTEESAKSSEEKDANDPYADYEIPDDLSW